MEAEHNQKGSGHSFGDKENSLFHCRPQSSSRVTPRPRGTLALQGGRGSEKVLKFLNINYSVIIVDVHEPELLKGVADKVQDLVIDYWIIGNRCHYVVERKTFSDLLSSLLGRAETKVRERIFEQLERLKEFKEKLESQGKKVCPILIIEGELDARITLEQWFGIQAKVAEMEIGLIRTESINETMICLKTLEKRAGKDLADLPKIPISKSLRDLKTEALHVLMAISGIGEKKAIKLLERFGSLKNVFNSSESDLKRVVGEKLAKHMKELFEQRFSSGLI